MNEARWGLDQPAQVVGEQLAVPAAWYRGGTSNALVVRRESLPTSDRDDLASWLWAAYGSGDVRQVDGLGAGDMLRSKFAIVGPSDRPDADVDYTFVQLGVSEKMIDWTILCGNISSVVGPYAVDEGLVPAVEPATTVRIYNSNTQSVIHATVQVRDGRARTEGDFEMAGVPGTGSVVELDFRESAGTQTGRVLPTGRVRDVLDVEGLGQVEVSIVDVSIPLVFVQASSLGVTGAESHAVLLADQKVRERVSAVRRAAAVMLGWASSVDRADEEARIRPGAVMVGPPAAWTDMRGVQLEAAACDLHVRAASVVNVHKAFMGTGSICAGVAARIPGTVVHDVTRPEAHERGEYRLGHPSGTTPVLVDLTMADGVPTITQASIERSARRMFEGRVLVPTRRLSWRP
jgi:2-methylaconitate cis-trans-isomerase PrpF